MDNNTKKTNQALEKLIYVLLRACSYFTAITLFLLIIQSLKADSRYVSPTRFLLIFPFGVSLAVGNLVLKSKSLSIFAKTVSHYLISVVSFYVFLIAPIGKSANPIPLILILTVVYFIVATPIIIIAAKKHKKELEEAPYVSIYSKKK